MHVNFNIKGFFNNRLVLGSGIVISLLVIFLIASSFTKRDDRTLRVKQTNLLIRQIGHQLLLQSGDRTSRVLPVTEFKEGTFQLTFEHEFIFNHDSLMSLSQKILTSAQFPSGYTVTAYDCSKAYEIVYGFQINIGTPSILACRGRMEPPGCYIIEFTFPDFYEATFNYPVIGLVGSGLLLSTVALLIGRFRKDLVPVHGHNHAATMKPHLKLTALGKFLFDVKNQRLLLGSEVISLTDKECKVLELLNENFGELIARESLMQKIWISEGVITGRSLDMFISKLRKKLSSDPELSITNIHGKGYKLQLR